MTPAIGEYAVLFDDDYFRAVAPRLRPVRGQGAWRGYASVVLLAIILVLHTLRSVQTEQWASIVVVALLVFLMAFAIWKATKLGLENFRRGANYGGEVRVTVSTDGVESVGPRVASRFAWSAFRRAVVSSDGIALGLTDESGLWLPDAALARGERAAIEAVIADNVPEVERR